jgi:hypothetical protein
LVSLLTTERENLHVRHDYMSEPHHHNDQLFRISDAIGLPRPQGWAARAVQCLTVWFIANLGWIVGGLVASVYLPEFRPPPGWAYWTLWCVVGGVVVATLIPVISRVRATESLPWLWFGALSLGMCVLEEVICYLMGTGMWENRSRFWPEFGLGVSVLMGWTIGTGLVLQLSGLGVWEALLLCGLSGWMAEALVVPRFFHGPLLLIWIIPLSIVSYLLLILPGMAVVGRDLPQPTVDLGGRGRRYCAALLIPLGCWVGVAIVIGHFIKL